MKVKPLQIRNVAIGGKRPVFILGPCVIESEKFVWRMARKIAEICAAENVEFIFKASYDKANRTSVHSFRGVGVREGCDILSEIGRELKIPVITWEQIQAGGVLHFVMGPKPSKWGSAWKPAPIAAD